MQLYDIWFVIVAVFWVGFFILEGFDFGVGMLHSFIGHTDLERRVAVNTIGPIWDGNEVWLIVAGAAIFAAFPAWYATMFSTFYLVMLIVLVALIGRGLSFEFRGKTENPTWRAVWQWSLTVGSALVPLLLGTGLGDLLFGLPIDENGNYTGSFLQLLVPFGLYTGVTLTILCLFLGATYLALKTTGDLRDRAARLSGRIGWIAALAVFVWVVWSHLGLHEGFLPQPIDILALLAIIGAAWLAESRSEGAAFSAGAVALAGVVGSIFWDLFPRVMVSSTDAQNSLTVAGSASPNYTLKVMTVVAIVFMPIVLSYQAWSLWTFRKRLGAPPQPTPPPEDPPLMNLPPDPAASGPSDPGPNLAHSAGG
jgi:cytochrome d ubiquinol oxidase subunit II